MNNTGNNIEEWIRQILLEREKKGFAKTFESEKLGREIEEIEGGSFVKRLLTVKGDPNYRIYSAEPLLPEKGFIKPDELLIGVKRIQSGYITTIYCKDQADMAMVDEIAGFYERRRWYF